jgi:hypothetical protein
MPSDSYVVQLDFGGLGYISVHIFWGILRLCIVGQRRLIYGISAALFSATK